MLDNAFESFKALKLSEGFDEVLQREWDAGFSNEPHQHDFDTEALVARGEFVLLINGEQIQYRTGDTFSVARGVVHSERYGPEGATFWAARKH